ncbi:hypothetical protein H0A66_03795 [Alcaligenaceae bacterium]|nr:hypothetical protein [Alcaligenaceae bacterium]
MSEFSPLAEIPRKMKIRQKMKFTEILRIWRFLVRQNDSIKSPGAIMLTLNQNEHSEEVFASQDALALEEAARLVRAIRGFAGDLGARAALILASQAYPDDALGVAAKKLATEFNALRAEAKAIGAKAEKMREAESQRVAPWFGPAINRQGEIRQKIEYLRKRVEAIGARKSNPSSQERDMRTRGVSAAEIDRVIGCDADIDGLLAQIAGLKAEQGKIDLFFKTEDPAVLPNSVHPRSMLKGQPQPREIDSDITAMIANTPVGG